MRWLACMLAVVLVSAFSALAPEQVTNSPSPGAAAHAVIQTLLREARQAREDQRLPRTRADIAQSLAEPVDVEYVGRRIAGRIDRDGFTDAYVRWQLTSFNPPLPDPLNDRRFDQMLAGLPPLLANPRADSAVVDEFRAIAQRGRLTEAGQASANDRLNALVERSSRIGAMNAPTLGLRDWLESRMAHDAPRQLLVRLERCRAMLDAGWPVGALVRSIDDAVESIGRDPEVSDDQRRRLLAAAERLAGVGSLVLSSARMVEGTLVLDYDAAEVYDFDIARWRRALTRPQP